ncbi:hypothetical protein WJX75_007521 [Coccomyxa subellipsoidea]|uniref:Uncharacterized protein n=1 Tax=Coccomyxa subellipsoidea TaxID=248742 RepID=A0ABR2YBZ8_9CHLO
MDKRSISPKVVTSLFVILFLSLGSVQGRLLKQAAARQGSATTSSQPYAESVRPVTPSSTRTSSSAGTKPPGVVSIDSSTSMAGTQQAGSLRDVTPSSYAPLSQTKASGTATTDQATVGPVRPVNSQGVATNNMQTSTASGSGNGQHMETMADEGSAMSMRQVP